MGKIGQLTYARLTKGFTLLDAVSCTIFNKLTSIQKLNFKG